MPAAQGARSLHRFANPGRFLRLTEAWMPWLWGLAVAVTGIGAAWALLGSPADWQQGETVRIMYVHVPMAWLAMGCYTGLAILSVMSLIWRHPLADLTARELSPVGAAATALCLATVSLASHTHQVPHMGLPQRLPVARQSAVAAAPTGESSRAVRSASGWRQISDMTDRIASPV